MFLSPRLSSRDLAELCHRLATQLDAGIDVRRVWNREVEGAPLRLRPHLNQVRDAVARGDSLATALSGSGSVFPRLFLELVDVGEQTGMLPEVFRRLERHYRHQLEMKRAFLGLVAWPMIQLGIAVVVVGLLIWILGAIAGRTGGEPIDILGWGLVGTRGLMIYTNLVIVIGLIIFAIITSFRRGMSWTKPIAGLAIQAPVLGPALQKICLARLAWAMHLTLNVEMDLRRLIPLALRATGNDYYIQHDEAIVRAVVSGDPMYAAFRATRIFPESFLDALEVGEESGRIVESMGRLSGHYQEESQAAMKTISVLAGVAVWMSVAGLLILIIFRLFGFYIGTINDAMNM